MIDPVALDHRAIWIDEDREGKTMSAGVIGHLFGALADDHQDLGPERMIYREMGSQLLQLRSAVGSPGAPDEHQYSCPVAEDIREPNFLAVASLQRKWRRYVTNAEACSFPGPSVLLGLCCPPCVWPLPLIIIRYLWRRRQHSFGHRLPVAHRT